MSATYWTRDRIIVAFRAWHAEHGRAPAKVRDWGRAAPHHPSAPAVDREFGSWNAGVVAAGLPVNRPGKPNTLTREQIAAEMLDWLLTHNSWPTGNQWDAAGMAPSRHRVEEIFGSWHAAKRFAGWRCSCDNCDGPLPEGRRRWCSERCRNWVIRHGHAMVTSLPEVCVECGAELENNTIGCKTCGDRARKRARVAARMLAAPAVLGGSIEPCETVLPLGGGIPFATTSDREADAPAVEEVKAA